DGDVGERVLDGTLDDPLDPLGVDAGVLGESDQGGTGRGELGPQRGQVLPRAETTGAGVAEDALERGRVAVRCGLLAGGVLDAAGEEPVHDEVSVSASDRHVVSLDVLGEEQVRVDGCAGFATGPDL